MQLLCFGLSHNTAPLEVRERLYQAALALNATGSDCASALVGHPGLEGCISLSTCNRLEFYVSLAPGAEAPERQFAAIRQRLHETGGEHPAYFYELIDREAALHLCRVACGLDSQVVGEPQILGQVAEAYRRAAEAGSAGPALGALFQAATRAGKRARRETGISRHATSFSAVALKLATAALGDLAGLNALVIGAGEMAALSAQALHKRGVASLTIANRTVSRAAALAQRWQARAVPLDGLEAALAQADLVIGATNAPHALVTAAMVQRARPGRTERPLLFVDLAVPRDIEPAVAALPNIQCLNLDTLQAHLDAGRAQRAQAIPQAEAIAAEAAERFMQWLEGLAVSRVIADLRARAEAIRRGEVEKTLRRLPNLNAAERQHVEALTEAVMNKLLHEPTLRLRAQAGERSAAEYASALRDLFGLDE